MNVNYSQADFKRFLKWLASEGNDSAEVYEHIRNVLIKIFNAKGFQSADEMADETIDRVISKIDELEKNYDGKKLHYFLSVARFIQLEHLKKRTFEIEIEKLEAMPDRNRFQDDDEIFSTNILLLKECLKKLNRKNRSIIWDYFNVSKKNKIEKHKKIAEKFSLTHNSLRIKVFRIKKNLAECIKNKKTKMGE